MKKLLLLFIAFMPFIPVFAENDGKGDAKIEINIQADKDGNIQITGLSRKELKKIEKEVNDALKDVSITINDGKQKKNVHLKAEIKID